MIKNKTVLVVAAVVLSAFVVSDASAASRKKMRVAAAPKAAAMPDFKPFPGNNPMTKPTYTMSNMKVDRVTPIVGNTPMSGTPAAKR